MHAKKIQKTFKKLTNSNLPYQIVKKLTLGLSESSYDLQIAALGVRDRERTAEGTSGPPPLSTSP